MLPRIRASEGTALTNRHKNAAITAAPIAVWFGFLTALASAFAYYRVFTGFSEYDTEGFLMTTVQQYLQGYKLYTEVVSAYGPVYYFYNWLIHSLSATPITHDVVRMTTLLPWLITPLICAWYVYRLTQSLVLASGVHVLTAYALGFFKGEPGHPQELALLLLVLAVAAGQMTSSHFWHWLGIVLLGSIPAALLLVKVNVGLFVTAGVAFAFSLHLPKTKLTNLSAILIGAGCILLPFALMKSRLDDSAAQVYCVVVSVALISLILRLLSLERVISISTRDCLVAIAAFAVVFGSVLALLKAQGTALTDVVNSLLLDNLRVRVNSRTWYEPAPLGMIWIPWAIAGFAVAALVRRCVRSQTIGWLSLVFSIGALFGLVFFPRHNLLGYAPPFSWLALGSPSRSSSRDFGRTVLCGVGILQTLTAYPQAGGQFVFVHVPLIVIAAACAGDSMVSLPIRTSVSPRLSRSVATALLVGVVAVYMVVVYQARQRYISLPALGLPGAERIHLDEAQARTYRWLSKNIEDHCSVIFGLPNLASLNFWTAKEPLTRLNADAWILLFTPEEQGIVRTALSEHEDACIIYNPDLVAFWNMAGALDVEVLPLVRYIRESFKVVGTAGQYHVLIRKERNVVFSLFPSPALHRSPT